MLSRRASSSSENSEDERALLQTRVALFWKVMFFIVLVSCALGAAGAIVKPGGELFLTLASTAQAGIFWWLCQRGVRSIRFSRSMEAGGLLLNSVIGALLGALPIRRVRSRSFGRERAGCRAGRRLFVADAAGWNGHATGDSRRADSISARAHHRRHGAVRRSDDFGELLSDTERRRWIRPASVRLERLSWMPGNLTMMWGFAVITSVVISPVIYGLRAEVRQRPPVRAVRARAEAR